MHFFGGKQESETIELVVQNMRCTSCEASVKIALRKVNGVRRVKVNRRRDQVVVTMDPERALTAEDLVATVTALGYRVEPA